MKKSKILGIGLGCAALTAVAIATPVIATSCSDNKDEATTVATKIKSIGKVYTGTTLAEAKNLIDANNIVYSTEADALTVYTGAATNKFVGITLVDNATDLLSNESLIEKGFEPTKTEAADKVTLEWTAPQGWERVDQTNSYYNQNEIATDSNVEFTAVLKQKGKTDVSLKITVTFKLAAKA